MAHLLCAFGFARSTRRSSSLYWAVASLVTGFLFSWLLWIVVIFELREELLEHYNRREPIGLRLNWFLTALFSFFYFQYELNKISREKDQVRRATSSQRQKPKLLTPLDAPLAPLVYCIQRHAHIRPQRASLSRDSRLCVYSRDSN